MGIVRENGAYTTFLELKATLNSNDVKTGNTIHLGTVDSKQSDIPIILWDQTLNSGKNTVYDQNGNKIGSLIVSGNDTNTLNYDLKVDTNKQYSDDVNITIQRSDFGYHTSRTDFKTSQLTNKSSINVIVNTNTKQYTFNYKVPHYEETPLSSKTSEWPFLVPPWGGIGFNVLNPGYSNAHDPEYLNGLSDAPRSTEPNGFHQVFEYSGNNFPTKFSDFFIKGRTQDVAIVDANGKLTDETVDLVNGYYDQNLKKIELPENLTAEQAYEQTPSGYVGFSHQTKNNQSDWIVSFNVPNSYFQLDRTYTTDQIKKNSFVYNVQESDQKDKVLQNTLNYWYNNNHGMPRYSIMGLDVDDSLPNGLFMVKNVTPQQHLGSNDVIDRDIHTVRRIVNGNAGEGQYKNYLIYQFVDDTTGTNVGAPISESGKAGTTGSLNLKVPDGYELAKGQTLPTSYTIPNQDTVVQIHLTHAPKPVNAAATATRTIHYVIGADGTGGKAFDDKSQDVSFSGTVDSITDNPISLKPNGQWDQVVSPDLKGYTPDMKVVNAETPSPNQKKEVTVHYLANNEKAKLRVIDDHTGLELQGYDEEANGKFDTAISFNKNPNDVAKELENKGYKVVSNSWKDGSKYQDGKNEFVIHVDHTTSTQTENHAQTRTIHYVDGKGNKISDDVVQKASFTRTGTEDNVTGQINWKDWTTTDKYPEVSSPAHDGYTPDKAKVDAVTPLYGQNQDQTVVYHRNGQGAEITYVDDTTGKVLKHEQAQGKYNDKIVFNSNVPDTIKGYENDGYVLVSNDFKDQNYSSDNTANKFTVHFKHGTKKVIRDKNVSQNIDYQIKENGTTHSVNHYKAPDLKFTQSGIQDQVTKETDWNGSVKDQQFKAVNTPTIKGYTPDIKQVPTTNIHVDSKNWNQDQNIKKTVTYTPDTETVKVIAKDRDTNKILNQSQLIGTYGSEYHATAPKITGYHLVKSPANTSGKFGTDNADVVYLYVKDTPADNSETTGTPKTDDISVFNQNLAKQDTKDLPEMSEANMAVTTLAGLGLLALTVLVPVIRHKFDN